MSPHSPTARRESRHPANLRVECTACSNQVGSLGVARMPRRGGGRSSPRGNARVTACRWGRRARASVALKRTILVVEDEKDIRELVRFHLEQEGYAVREADTGESALAQVAAERPALVMLDIMLPGTDGLEVCRRLRSAEATHAIP